MTDNTRPEALRLAEQYDYGDRATYGNAWKAAVCTELRRQHTRIVELEAQLEAVGAGGVQALSAAPAGWKLVPVEPTGVMLTAAEIAIAGAGKTLGRYNAYAAAYRALLAASPTPTAEQAAPKAEPAPQTIRRFYRGTDCMAENQSGDWVRYEDHVAALVDALQPAPNAAPQQEAQEPTQEMVDAVMSLVDLEVSDPEDHRYDDGSKLAAQICRAVLALAPQPAPAPLSDDTERLEWLLWKLPGDALRYVVGELADTSSGAEFRAAIDAALAAQGGKV